MPWVERIPDERQVADLAGRAVGSADELVVDDEAHPDAGADGDEHHRGHAPGEAEPLLAHGGEVDVVVDEHGEIEAVADHLEWVESAFRSDVVGERGDATAGLVDDARGGDAQRQRPAAIRTGLVHHLADHLQDLHAYGPGADLGRRALEIADRLAEQIRGGDPHVGAADVGADDETGAVGDDIGDRAAPALAGASAGGVDETGVLEPSHGGRHGRLGQTGGG